MPQLEFGHQFNYRPLLVESGGRKELTIEIIPNVQYKTEILFSEFPIPRNLLGHHGFFNKMAVALRSKIGLIYLNPEA